ncbi:MAG TPA: FAD-linked oxidase C-terminal domain-containing protein [bacterium]
MLPKTVIHSIGNLIGKDKITAEKEDLVCYSYDAMNQSFMPDAVVFPENTQDIAKLLKLANEQGIPVVPRGAGSGQTGGAVPAQGGIVLSFEDMRKIIRINRENLSAIVEPGVITGELHKAVESLGLFYPPDPASLDFCTIGGNVAENAGGVRAVKYGVTRDYVLGLEVVLPDGRIINPGHETVKDVAGYDLTGLFVGSEGTLGAITRVILKLLPKPRTKITFLAAFRRVVDSLNTVTKIFGLGILPSAIEFIDRTCIKLVKEHAKISVPDETEALLLIEDDGSEEAVRFSGTIIESALKNCGASSIEKAVMPDRIQELWRARRAISPSLAKISRHKLNEDVVVPRNQLSALLSATYPIAEKHSLTCANFGHAGDGNIHVNILYNDKNEKERAMLAVEEIMKKTVELGGTITGEHGIGLAKKPFIKIELSDAELSILRKIKGVFDPNNILNPGKIFPEA